MEQQTPVLQKMEEAITLVKLLQREKDDALAQCQSLENENKELKKSLSTIESKLDEILAVGSVSANR